MCFEFATAGKVVFGAGVLQDFRPNEYGRKPLIVGGQTSARLAPLIKILEAAGLSWACYPVSGEPTIDAIARGVTEARARRCDFVIGFGGGSAIDAGKAIAALLNNPGEVIDYLEVIGKSKPLAHAPVPYIAIPTTAGTGAEVTRNAVLASPEHRVKVSLRSPLLLPRLALVDPELTRDLPPALTASTGMDALTQLIEAYVCTRANPITDSFCLDGLRRAARSLVRAWHAPGDMAARTDMSLASLLSGMALANAGLGAVHGFAAAIGGMFPAPHGAVCAALLPHVMEANIRLLRERRPEPENLFRYRQIACVLTNRDTAEPEDGIVRVRETCREFQIPGLRSYGIGAADVEIVCEKAASASSMKPNPVVLPTVTLRGILEQAL
jgi:alcohol dehydrogenase class IV